MFKFKIGDVVLVRETDKSLVEYNQFKIVSARIRINTEVDEYGYKDISRTIEYHLGNNTGKEYAFEDDLYPLTHKHNV